MSRMTTAELGLAPAAVADNNGGNFDVFASLRGGAESDNFSSGDGDIGEEAAAGVDEAAGKIDLVAVASGEKKLPSTEEVSASIGQTACVTCVGCPFLSQCARPQALAVKQESENQENISADEEAVPNLMEMTPKQSYLERLLAPDDFDSLDESGRGELVMAGYSVSTDHREPIIKKAPEPAAAETKPIDLTTETDGPTEKITPQGRKGKTSTSEPAEALGDDVDAEVAEALFFGLKTAPEIATDDTTDVGEFRSKSTSEISGEGHFTETVEVSSPSIEVKPHVIDSISDADDDNKQSTPEFLDTPAQAETAPASLAINEGNQTVDKNSNPLENEIAYPMVSEDKVTASVVENTYNGDETTAPSSVKTPSSEHQKENNFVITGSKSANSELSRAVENDESATPVSEQRHLAARFEAVKADEPAVKEPIYNSGTKASTDTQPSEINIDAAADYNNFVKSIDSVNAEQPKYVTPTAANVSPPQEQEDAINVSAEYETNEASTEEATNVSAPIPAKEQTNQHRPVIVSLSTQDIVEHGESSLSADEEFTVDRSPTRPDVINKPTTHEVIEATREADETIELETMNVTLPVEAAAVSEGGKNQIDLQPELNEELVVDKRVYETQASLVEQFDHNDATVGCDYGEDNEAWAEEDMVFFVEQQSPAVESEVSSAEAVTIALPMEATTAREEADNLKLSVDDEIGVDMDSVEQLDNFKTSSVPEITNDYEPVEHIAIPISPAIELIRDVELDESAVEILEERITPREERDNMTVKTSEKSDLLRLDAEVETIITDTSGIESVVDLSEEQAEPTFVNKLYGESEPEVDKQNDLAVDSAVDSYGYNSETSAVSDNVLVVKSCPSSGLWPDDSRLNPENNKISKGSSTSIASWLTKLVGTVAVYVACSRRESVPGSLPLRHIY